MTRKSAAKLSDDQKWTVVCADPGESNSRLAARFGSTKTTVGNLRRDGWTCPVWYRDCVRCSQPMTARKANQIYHTHCTDDTPVAKVGTRSVVRLTDDQNWLIINAPSGLSTAALAREMGCRYAAVYQNRQRFREMGWTCEVDYGHCSVCGGLMTFNTAGKQQRYHPECAPIGKARLARRLVRRKYNRSAQAQNNHQWWTMADDDWLLEHYNVLELTEVARHLRRTTYAVQTRYKRIRDRTAN